MWVDPTTEAWKYSPFRFAAAAAGDEKFEAKAAYAHPGPVEAYDQRRRKRVCVVGGGIAGLTAAYELALLEHEVVLLEASNRFGGRILTHYFADGTYGELGAMRIPEDHRCVWHYIDRFGLATRRFRSDNPMGWCLFRDQPKSRRQDWEEGGAQACYGLGSQWSGRRAADVVAVDIDSTLARTDAQEWESLSNELGSRHLVYLESMTLGQHVLGIPGRVRRVLTDEEWNYIGR